MAALNVLAEDEGMLAGSDDYAASGASASPAGALSSLDSPGTMQAMEKLMRSSEQARAALQQAREKIAGRKYNRAIALLAVSGALGQPTRSGGAGEGWANAANALIGPLRDKDQFEANRDKEVLGIDTSIAGIDERMAMSQLQLEQLRAKMLADQQKVGNEITVENGKPTFRKPWQSTGSEAYVTPNASTNISVNTDKSFYGTWGEKRAAATDALYEAAQTAPQSIERAKQIQQALKNGAITGTAAEAKLGIAKIAKAFGWNDANDWVANTEGMASGLAKGTLDLIAPSKLGGGSGFSNADRDFLDKVSGNKISLDAKTIERLMGLHIKAQKATVKKWNSTYDRLDKKQMDIMGITKIDLPEDEEEAAAQAEAAEVAEHAAPEQPPAVAASGVPPLLARPGAQPAISPGASPKYGFANPETTVDPATPTPRAPPQMEQYLRQHPETADQFVEEFGYLPSGL
jgi:hypothetical protein